MSKYRKIPHGTYKEKRKISKQIIPHRKTTNNYRKMHNNPLHHFVHIYKLASKRWSEQ